MNRGRRRALHVVPTALPVRNQQEVRPSTPIPGCGSWSELRQTAPAGDLSSTVRPRGPHGKQPPDWLRIAVPGAYACSVLFVEDGSPLHRYSARMPRPRTLRQLTPVRREVLMRMPFEMPKAGSSLRSRASLIHGERRRIVRRIGVLVAACAFLIVLSVPVGAQTQPPDWYDENAFTFDPHGLISMLPWVSAYGSGTDTWEVWVCWTPGELVANIHDPERLTKWLNEESDVIPYFRWLSGDRYRPAFRVGGTVESNHSQQVMRWLDCADRAKQASAGGANGALIIDTSSSEEGLAGPGEWCRAGECGSFPGNDRWAIVGGDAFADTYAHEIGHALHWPHSFSHGSSWEYDNPMDIMGSPTNDGKREWRATPAVNRYAAGWIDPDDVATWHSAKGVTKFRIDPIGVSTTNGKQMVALTYTDDGVFDMLGARVRGGYDLDIPKEGVEIYRVDQRSDACDNDLACISLNRRIWQHGSADAAEHVLEPGESLSIPIIYSDGTEGARIITVKRRVEDSFDVVIGPPFDGTFRDDDGSVHEVNIEAIAQESITRGCDTDFDLFCPGRPVTRAQLAVLLIRATADEESLPAASGTVYSDVAADAWYARYVEWFASHAWTDPQGAFRPSDPATRAEVAEFIVRLLPTVAMASESTGRFADVPADHPYIRAIEALAVADITKGCGTDPPRFCPDKPVSRAEVATFLVRALTATHTDSVASTGGHVAGGYAHSCAVRKHGAVLCWGGTYKGESDAPSGEFTAVSAYSFHSCGIRTDRTVTCWGSDDQGQSAAPSGEFTAVSAGNSHSCGIRTDRTVTCWGSDDQGQSAAPSGEFTAVSAGNSHSCGIRTDRTVTCWGSNHSGELDAPSDLFIDVAVGGSYSCGITGLRTDGPIICWGETFYGLLDTPSGRFVAITAGPYHSCGIRTDGTTACWGNGGFGRLDAPSGQFSAIAAGRNHSCGMRLDSTVACWGDNWHGQSKIPEIFGREFTAIAAAERHTCAIRAEGSVECWGNRPEAPSGTFTDIATGRFHTCGIRTDRTLTCWGHNYMGKLDAPSGEFDAITAGGHHSCGIRIDSTPVCWGLNDSGQSDTPSGEFITIDSGEYHSCAIRTDYTAVCWGAGGLGRLDVPSGEFLAIAAGSRHSCGILTDHTVTCWGDRERFLAGALEAPPGEFTTVTAGEHYSCGIRTDGTAVCWSGSRIGRVDAPIGRFVAIDAGTDHVCAISEEGAAECWGSNRYGQLGVPD